MANPPNNNNQVQSNQRTTKELSSQLSLVEQIRGLLGEVNELLDSGSSSVSKQLGHYEDLKGAIEENNEKTKDLEKSTGSLIKKLGLVALGAAAITKAYKMVTGTVKVLFSSLTSVVKSVFQLGKSIIALPFRLFGAFVKITDDLMSGSSGWREAVEEIREEYGALGQKVPSALLSIGRSLRGVLGAAGAGRVFATSGEALQKIFETAKGMGPLFNIFVEEFKKSEGRLLGIQMGLGLAAEDMKVLGAVAVSSGQTLEKQLLEIEKYSSSLGKAFGVETKLIARDVAKAMADVGKFGGATIKELSVASVYARKLGLELKDIAGTLDAFETFESAAQNVSKLSQSFGVQVDAFKLMAAQDPAKQIDELRKGFARAGQDASTFNRQQLKLLASSTGLSEEVARQAFSLKNQGKSMDEINKKAAEQEKKQLTQVQVLDKLANAIKKVVENGSQVAGFFSKFVQGFELGIMRSSSFRKIIINIKGDMNILRKEGISLGKAFVDTFPGVKDIFEGIADIMQPSRFRSLVRTFTSELKTGFLLFESGKYSFTDFMTRLGEAFDIWAKGSGAGAGRMLSGFKTFFTVAGKILGQMIAWMARKVKEGIILLVDILTGKKKIGINYGEGASIIMEIFGPLGEGLKYAFQELSSLFSAEFKAWVKKAFEDILKIFNEDILPSLKSIGTTLAIVGSAALGAGILYKLVTTLGGFVASIGGKGAGKAAAAAGAFTKVGAVVGTITTLISVAIVFATVADFVDSIVDSAKKLKDTSPQQIESFTKLMDEVVNAILGLTPVLTIVATMGAVGAKAGPAGGIAAKGMLLVGGAAVLLMWLALKFFLDKITGEVEDIVEVINDFKVKDGDLDTFQKKSTVFISVLQAMGSLLSGSFANFMSFKFDSDVIEKIGDLMTGMISSMKDFIVDINNVLRGINDDEIKKAEKYSKTLIGAVTAISSLVNAFKLPPDFYEAVEEIADEMGNWSGLKAIEKMIDGQKAFVELLLGKPGEKSPLVELVQSLAKIDIPKNFNESGLSTISNLIETVSKIFEALPKGKDLDLFRKIESKTLGYTRFGPDAAAENVASIIVIDTDKLKKYMEVAATAATQIIDHLLANDKLSALFEKIKTVDPKSLEGFSKIISAIGDVFGSFAELSSSLGPELTKQIDQAQWSEILGKTEKAGEELDAITRVVRFYQNLISGVTIRELMTNISSMVSEIPNDPTFISKAETAVKLMNMVSTLAKVFKDLNPPPQNAIFSFFRKDKSFVEIIDNMSNELSKLIKGDAGGSVLSKFISTVGELDKILNTGIGNKGKGKKPLEVFESLRTFLDVIQGSAPILAGLSDTTNTSSLSKLTEKINSDVIKSTFSRLQIGFLALKDVFTADFSSILDGLNKSFPQKSFDKLGNSFESLEKVVTSKVMSGIGVISDFVHKVKALQDDISGISNNPIDIAAVLNKTIDGFKAEGKIPTVEMKGGFQLNVNFSVTMNAGQVEEALVLRPESAIGGWINYAVAQNPLENIKKPFNGSTIQKPTDEYKPSGG